MAGKWCFVALMAVAVLLVASPAGAQEFELVKTLNLKDQSSSPEILGVIGFTGLE